METKAVELMTTVLGDKDVAERVCTLIANSTKLPTKEQLMRLRGVTERRANIVLACLELSATPIVGTESKVYLGPGEVARRLCFLKYTVQEEFYIMTLDSHNHEIGVHEICVGLVNKTPVHPREAFAHAVADRAVAVIFAHNHPSGDSSPSNDDYAITRVLCAAGKIMQIPVLDHIIVSRTGFTSICKDSPEIFEYGLDAEDKWQTA